MIQKALLAGWTRWFREGERPSQVYYVQQTDDRVCCAEGDGRLRVAEQMALFPDGRVIADFTAACPTGIYVSRRLAARLAAFAGWPAGSSESAALCDYILRQNLPVTIKWWDSAQDAYIKAPHAGACCIHDRYKFSKSCMAGEYAGEVYDYCASYKCCIGFIDPRSGEHVGRGNVWHLPNGGLAVEVLFGVPPGIVDSVVKLLKNEGIISLDSYFEDGGEPFHAGLDIPRYRTVTCGYCDYLAAHAGRDAMVFPFREGGRNISSIIEIGSDGCHEGLCPDCGEGHLLIDYIGDDEVSCPRCGHSVSVQRCEYCGERYNDGKASGPNGEYCSTACADNAGWRMCDNCDDWFREDDGAGSENQYCCSSCAQTCGEAQCENCCDWHDAGGGIIVDDESCCCESCAKEYGWAECPICEKWHGESYGPDENCCCAPHGAQDAEKRGLKQCHECEKWFAEDELSEIEGRMCCPRCYLQMKNTADIRRGQMVLDFYYRVPKVVDGVEEPIKAVLRELMYDANMRYIEECRLSKRIEGGIEKGIEKMERIAV